MVYRNFFILFLFSFLPVQIVASGAIDSKSTNDELICKGTVSDIKIRLINDEYFVKYTFGEKKDNLLMHALEADQKLGVIKLLLSAGISPVLTNTNAQNAIMYACRYSSDSAVILQVITNRTLSKKAVRKRLLKKDVNGACAVDYAFEYSNKNALPIICKYLSLDDLAKYETQDITQGVKVNQSAEKSVSVPTQLQTHSAASLTPDASTVISTENTSNLQQKVTSPENSSLNTFPSASIPPVSTYHRIYLFEDIPDEPMPENEPDSNETKLVFIQDANVIDANGLTPLMKAVKAGDDRETNSLLFSGAQVNSQDKDGWTPLMYAVRYQSSEKIVELLIQNGAEIKARNNFGMTPLSLAAGYSYNPAVVSTLLSAYSITENEVFKSFIYAITNTTEKFSVLQETKLKQFIDKGIPVNRFWEGKTPLMYAAETANTTEPIAFLIKNGALSSLHSTDGKTAFDYAQANTKLPHNTIYWSLNIGSRKQE